MKTIAAAAALVFALPLSAGVLAPPAQAAGFGGFHGGGGSGFHGSGLGHGGFHGHGFAGWHGGFGGWRGGFGGWHGGWCCGWRGWHGWWGWRGGIYFDAPFYGAYWPDDYAYDDYPPDAYSDAYPQYAPDQAEPGDAPATDEPAPSRTWYYCSEPKGYYPHVRSCNRQWLPVPVQAQDEHASGSAR